MPAWRTGSRAPCRCRGSAGLPRRGCTGGRVPWCAEPTTGRSRWGGVVVEHGDPSIRQLDELAPVVRVADHREQGLAAGLGDGVRVEEDGVGGDCRGDRRVAGAAQHLVERRNPVGDLREAPPGRYRAWAGRRGGCALHGRDDHAPPRRRGEDYGVARAHLEHPTTSLQPRLRLKVCRGVGPPRAPGGTRRESTHQTVDLGQRERDHLARWLTLEEALQWLVLGQHRISLPAYRRAARHRVHLPLAHETRCWSCWSYCCRSSHSVPARTDTGECHSLHFCGSRGGCSGGP